MVAARLTASGFHALVVDGRNVRDKASALHAVRVAADFPEWVGNNLDALLDALRDLSWLETGRPVAVVWSNADRLALLAERDRNGLLATLRDAETHTGPVSAVYLLDWEDPEATSI